MTPYSDRQVGDFYLKNRDLLERCYAGLTPAYLAKVWHQFHFFSMSDGDFTVFQQGLLQGLPLQHILGYASFYNLDIWVGHTPRKVLLPRMETEYLVEEGLAFLKGLPGTPKILDVGTGPGTILFALLKAWGRPAKALGIDLSSEALELAALNLDKLQYSRHPLAELNFQLGDRLEGVEGSFDLIISNPPYIKRSQSVSVHWQVQQHEPELALYLEDQHYEEWFEFLFCGVKKHLAPGGLFLMEGHEDNLGELLAQARRHFSGAELADDLSGRPRFLRAHA